MKGIVWFVIGVLLFVFIIVTAVFTFVGFGKRKKLIENAAVIFKLKDKTAKLNLLYALLFVFQVPISIFRALRDFSEFNTFGGWGEILFSSSIVIMCILDIIIYTKTKNAYITDEGFISSDRLLGKADMKYIILPDSIELYYKNKPRPIKLEMTENQSEIIDMLEKNYTKNTEGEII